MHFKILGRIADVELIASGSAIRERKRLWKIYGKGTLEEAEGNCKGRIFRWYDKPCRDSLVRSSWDRCEGTQNQANRRVRRNEAKPASSFACGTKTTLPLWNCGRYIVC